MKILLILLLFFYPVNTIGKTITTPYIKVGEINQNYITKENEKIDTVKYYYQEKINREYKYLEKPNDEYKVKGNEIKYSKYSKYMTTKYNDKGKDMDSKTIYYYQDLKKIDSLIIGNIKNLLITKIVLKENNDIIYNSNDYNIKLNKKYSPINLTLEVTCFLNQGDMKGEFTLKNSSYIENNIKVTKKGYSIVKIKLINSLAKTLYEKEILKTTNIEDKNYINIVDKKKVYRYRRVYYKFYKDDNIVDTKIHDGYKVIGEFNKYYLFRKEKIEVYDDIILDDYFDISKVIKSSTVDLKKIKFNYSNNCSNATITIKYRDFSFKENVLFRCRKYPKSKTIKGKKSFISSLIAKFVG